MTDDSAPAAASLTAASLCHLREQPLTLNMTRRSSPVETDPAHAAKTDFHRLNK